MKRSYRFAGKMAYGLSLLLLFAFPALAQSPSFVPRGPSRNAVDQGFTGICARYGAMDLWPDGRALLAWSGTSSFWLDYRPDGVPVTNQIQLIGSGDRVDVATTAPTLTWPSFVATFSRRTGSAADGLYFKIVRPETGAQPAPVRFEGAAGVRSAIAAGSDGSFVVAWETCCPTAVWVARFDADGNQLGADIPVAAGIGPGLESLDLQRQADGGFGVFWIADGDIQYRRFAAQGTPLEEVQTVKAPVPTLLRAAVAADGTLAFVYTRGGDALAARFVGADGQIGDEFTVFDQAPSPASRASAVFLADGDLAVAAEIRFDGGASSVHLFRFGRDGEPVGGRVAIAIPTVPGNNFADPLIAAADGDRVAVYYHLEGDTGPGCQIHSRYFDATLFADGFESGSLAAWAAGS